MSGAPSTGLPAREPLAPPAPPPGDARGFTLLELMIVTVILGIVAAIAAEAYTGIRRRAAAVTVQTDARKVPAAVETHLAEHGSLPRDLAALEAAGFNASERVCVSAFEEGDGSVAVTLRHRDYGAAFRFDYPGDASPRPVDASDGTCLGEGSDDDGWSPPWWWPW